MRRGLDGYFFIKANTQAVMDHQRKLTRDKAAQLAVPSMSPEEVERLAKEVAHEFSINVPVLDEASIQAAQQPTQIDVSQDWNRAVFDRGRPHYMEGTEITITVPFTGDSAMFSIRPMRYTSSPPAGDISGNEIVFTRRGVGLNAEQVRREFDAWLVDVKNHLDWHRQSLGNFNQDLVGVARAEIAQRQTKLSADQNLVAGLGFPVRR